MTREIEKAITRANVLRFEAFSTNSAELHREASAQVLEAQALVVLEQCRAVMQEATRKLEVRR